MNKIIIPALLGIAVLVAGIFALVPIEKASTSHLTIQANTLGIVTVTQTTANCNIANANVCDLEVTIPNGVNALLMTLEIDITDGGTAGDDDVPTFAEIQLNGVGASGVDPVDNADSINQVNMVVEGQGANSITLDVDTAGEFDDGDTVTFKLTLLMSEEDNPDGVTIVKPT